MDIVADLVTKVQNVYLAITGSTLFSLATILILNGKRIKNIRLVESTNTKTKTEFTLAIDKESKQREEMKRDMIFMLEDRIEGYNKAIETITDEDKIKEYEEKIDKYKEILNRYL